MLFSNPSLARREGIFMAEAAKQEQPNISPELAELRLLADVDHLLDAMRPDGTVPHDVQTDVKTNRKTAVYEMAMPAGVSTTVHRVEYQENETGQRQQVITWLGRNVVANTIKGKEYHHSHAAYLRTDVDVAAVQYEQDRLRPGIAQGYISPKMTPYDAPKEIAEAEHLYADDSIRVSYPIVDTRGEVIARRLESLLVTDVLLEDWVAMLKDPGNMFGRALPIRDEYSAISVMELFRELELPEELFPEGPITLVAAVVPYIQEFARQQSVMRQLEAFRKNQATYKQQAEKTASQWLEFDLELARSLHTGQATFKIKAFIAVLQHQWSDEDLEVINNHQLEDNEYIMTRQLAAKLEHAKQNLLNSIAAIATGNQKVLAQVDRSTAQSIQNDIHYLATLQGEISVHEYNRLQAQLDRRIASQNLRVGGGCPGENQANFKALDDSDNDGLGQQRDPQTDGHDKKNWKWKLGKCQVKSCPSPKPTEVGPCSVCRRCQSKFDAGQDPTKAILRRKNKANKRPETEFSRPKKTAERSGLTAEADTAKQVEKAFGELGIASFEAEQAKSKANRLQPLGRVALLV